MNKLPSQIAKELLSLKNKHGSVKKAAEIFSVSPATASRYLRLNKLSGEEIDSVDKGLRPIRIPKNKSSFPKLSLSERDENILFLLSRIRFSFISQLSRYLKISESVIRNTIEGLISRDYVSKDKGYLPNIISLTTKGCIFSDINKPKHFISGSAIHQYLLRNEIELQMREKNKSALFISRTDCWQRGLMPSVGEHAVEFDSGDKKNIALVLIDDYLMQPSRVIRSLIRLHDKNKSYVAGNLNICWADFIDFLFVYSTSDKQLSNHKHFYVNNELEFKRLNVTPAYRYISPIWGGNNG